MTTRLEIDVPCHGYLLDRHHFVYWLIPLPVSAGGAVVRGGHSLQGCASSRPTRGADFCGSEKGRGLGRVLQVCGLKLSRVKKSP